MAKKKSFVLDLPVAFGSVSFGKKTARVGINVSRDELKLGVADKTFCDRRLTVSISAAANGDQAGQGRLEGMDESLTLESVADVKGFGVHAATIGFGLTFNIVELKRIAEATGTHFNDFAGREGRLQIEDIGEIPEAEKTPDEPASEE